MFEWIESITTYTVFLSFQHESPLEKAAELSSALMEHLQTACEGSCGIITPRLVSEAAFRCYSPQENEITFRAQLLGSNQTTLHQMIQHLREWVRQNPSLRVGGVLLRVDPDCEVVIESLNSAECGGDLGTDTTTTMTTVTEGASSQSTFHAPTSK